VNCNAFPNLTKRLITSKAVAISAELQRSLAQKVLKVRLSGFAAGREARLCLAAKSPMTLGSALGPDFGP
jgi:hypothetical protein